MSSLRMNCVILCVCVCVFVCVCVGVYPSAPMYMAPPPPYPGPPQNWCPPPGKHTHTRFWIGSVALVTCSPSLCVSQWLLETLKQQKRPAAPSTIPATLTASTCPW